MKKWKKSRIITALTLCAVTAVSVMSIGLASWQTTITGSGSVSAAGKWDVAVTDASLQLSTGASASKEVTTYELEPAIGAGDVVILCRTDPAALEVGDVIQYQSDGCTVIHRIVEKDGDTFITRGDANNAPDLRPVEREQVLGRVPGTLPDAGWFILWLHRY